MQKLLQVTSLAVSDETTFLVLDHASPLSTTMRKLFLRLQEALETSFLPRLISKLVKFTLSATAVLIQVL